MKRNEWRKLAAFALLLALCAALLAGCGKGGDEPFRLEKNEGRNAASYPYVVHMDSATWYLAKADMELLGEDAYLEGFRALAANQEADFSDAREALKGFIWEEIPPVEIYTDFAGKTEEARFEGGYYYGDGRIRVFTDWNAAGQSLMHEYVHYLSVSCTDTPVGGHFWAEGLADYVTKIACENRMARAVYRGETKENLQYFIDHGAADPETGEFDPARYTYGMAEVVNDEANVGQTYLTIFSTFMVMQENRLEHLTVSSLSYFEAASMVSYLVETRGRDAAFSRWNTADADLEAVFGKSLKEFYVEWRAWNLERCTELGLDLTVDG